MEGSADFNCSIGSALKALGACNFRFNPDITNASNVVFDSSA
jgi:hypothetical protein